MREPFEKTTILGLRIDLINLEEVIDYVIFMIHNQRKAVISYVNVHAVNIAYKHGWFKDFVNHSQVVFCDGHGVRWIAKFINGKNLQRISPPDWFDILAEKCSEEGISIFLLGSRQEVIEKMESLIRKIHPKINIAGIHHGYFNKDYNSSENQALKARINLLHPDLLVVGFGMPVQEKWISENWDDLEVNVVLPVGAMFDYLTGDVRRAPRWMTDHGLEWMGRLIIEPHRLWKRYIIGNSLFIWRIIKHHILGFPLPD